MIQQLFRIGTRYARHILLAPLALACTLGSPPVQAHDDPTFNGVLKAIDFDMSIFVRCDGDTCEPVGRLVGKVNFSFKERLWQSPPLNGPTGPLQILSASPALIGKPLRVDFTFKVNDELGSMRAVLIARPNRATDFVIGLAVTSNDREQKRLIWQSSCGIDVFAR